VPYPFGASRLHPVFGDLDGAAFVAVWSAPVFDLVTLTGVSGYAEIREEPADAEDLAAAIAALNGRHQVFCITSTATTL
jgi:hypothetical protein